MPDSPPARSFVLPPQRAGAAAAPAYNEHVRVPEMSVGVYSLPAGAADPQQPHTEDEVYAVLSGRGMLEIDGAPHPVATGSVAFVAAGTAHRFVAVTEDLRVLVVFAPAENSRKATRPHEQPRNDQAPLEGR